MKFGSQRNLALLLTLLAGALVFAACTRPATTRDPITDAADGVLEGAGDIVDAGAEAAADGVEAAKDVVEDAAEGVQDATGSAEQTLEAVVNFGLTATAQAEQVVLPESDPAPTGEAGAAADAADDAAEVPQPTVTPIPVPTATPEPAPTEAPAAEAPTTYTVQPGDWLSAIARKLGVDPQAIIDANPGINADNLEVGQVLNLPTGASAPAAAQDNNAAASGNTHVVQQGETLFRIAVNNGTDVDTLKQLNGLTSNLIYPGDVIQLP